VAAQVGDQKAALAANGVDVSSGSPVEILASTKFLGEGDALTDPRQRRAPRLGAGRAGPRLSNEEGMDRSTAGSMNPWMAAGGSLLTSGQSVANRWYGWRESQYGKGG
jgi:hypothetical protein